MITPDKPGDPRWYAVVRVQHEKDWDGCVDDHVSKLNHMIATIPGMRERLQKRGAEIHVFDVDGTDYYRVIEEASELKFAMLNRQETFRFQTYSGYTRYSPRDEAFIDEINRLYDLDQYQRIVLVEPVIQ